MMQELDYNDMITEMVLGHIVGGNHCNPYLRADLYQKRCELMQTWADYIDDLANGKDVTKYKGIYRQPHDEIIKVLINMIGVDDIHQLLQQHREWSKGNLSIDNKTPYFLVTQLPYWFCLELLVTFWLR